MQLTAATTPSSSPLLLTGAILGALRVTSMGSKLLLLLYMGRARSAAELGTYGIFTATCALVVALVGLEYHQYAVRALLQSEERTRGAIVFGQVQVYLLTYTVAPLVVVPMFLASGMPQYCAFFLVAVTAGSHLTQECQRLLTALSRPVMAHVISAMATGLWVFPVLGMGWLQPGSVTLPSILTAWAISSWLAALLGVACVRATGILEGARLRDARPDRAGIRSGFVFLVSTLCLIGIDTIDRYMLGWFRTTAEVGVYTFHANIARAHREVLFAIAVAPVLPLLISQRGGAEPDSRRARHSARYLPLTGLGLGLLLVIAIKFALYFANKPVLTEHVAIFYYLLAGNVALGLSTVAHYALYARHREVVLMFAHLGGLVAALLGSLLLVPRFGAFGSAVANTLALSGMAMFKYSVYLRVRREEIAPGGLGGDTR